MDNLIITITKIDVSPDLRYAKVFLSFINSNNKTNFIIKKLNQYAKSYKFIIGKEIRLRRIPELRFCHDMMYNCSLDT